MKPYGISKGCLGGLVCDEVDFVAHGAAEAAAFDGLWCGSHLGKPCSDGEV